MDRFYTGQDAVLMIAPVFFPPLGAYPYLVGWAWFTLTALIFGAAFMLACLTLTRGQRAIASSALLLIWVLPRVLTPAMPQLLDITATVFYPQFSLAPSRHVAATNPLLQFMTQHPAWNMDAPPPAGLVQPILHFSLADIPASFLPPAILLWNRLFFLGLALVLLVVTIYGTQALRRQA
jgi:hypothetical protein